MKLYFGGAMNQATEQKCALLFQNITTFVLRKIILRAQYEMLIVT